MVFSLECVLVGWIFYRSLTKPLHMFRDFSIVANAEHVRSTSLLVFSLSQSLCCGGKIAKFVAVLHVFDSNSNQYEGDEHNSPLISYHFTCDC